MLGWSLMRLACFSNKVWVWNLFQYRSWFILKAHNAWIMDMVPLAMYISCHVVFHTQEFHLWRYRRPHCIRHICHFFYTGKIFGEWNLHRKRVNYKKWILRQNSINQNLLGKAMKKCLKLHTKCKNTLILCKNKKKNTHKLHKVCEITHWV